MSYTKKVWEENTVNFKDLHSHADTDTTAAPHQRYEDSNQHWEISCKNEEEHIQEPLSEILSYNTLTKRNSKLGTSLNLKINFHSLLNISYLDELVNY